MPGGHGGAALAARAGYGLACVLAAIVLVVSGGSYMLVRQVTSIGGSDAIRSGPSGGAQNILLMGLESRTDWQGNILPDGVLDALHACSRAGIEFDGCGGNATNTLILIHIFAGGQRAVGFSIPRDDWVSLYGTFGMQPMGKIDQAYGVAMAARQDQIKKQDPNISQDQYAFEGNEAGRAAAVQTVEALTGVHIDHFAELNLDGFYELARHFGGIEVCLNHATSDLTYSGANFRRGYQHLAAKQALAFVRQRHNLVNGDLDRTHRQQAVLDYVIWNLRRQGALSDLGQLSSLLGIARQYLITDAGWDLLDFVSEMRSLGGGNLRFETLPVGTTDGHVQVGGQTEDVNLIDPTAIRAIVQKAFSAPPAAGAGHSAARKPAAPKAPPAAPAVVDVYNGGGTPGLAGQLSQALTSAGFRAGKVGNIAAQSSTEVLYGTGESAPAAKIAGYFTGLTASASSQVAAGHVEVLLGSDATHVPAAITASPAAGPGPGGTGPGGVTGSGPSAPPSTSAANDGQSGGAVTVRPNAPYGIPCVD